MKLAKVLSNNRILLENFSYLSLLQIFGLASPLITYPYLLRLFGLDLYGTVIFAQTITSNIAIFINYGFNLSGTQSIAENHKNKERVNEIVTNIYTIKGMLWLLCFVIYSAIVCNFDYFSKFRMLYILSYFFTLNDVLLPVWFFQGIEKMKYITFINIGTRLFFIILTFILVKSSNEYIFVPILNALGAILGGLVAIYLVFRTHEVRFKTPHTLTLRQYFNASTPFFISSLSVNVYANISRLIVGSFLGMKEVTIYDMSEKITSILKIPGSLICQASFPRICKTKSLHFVNRLMLISMSIVMILYIGIYFSAGKIVEILSGEQIPVATSVIRILTLTALCAITNGFFGSNRLVIWGYKRTYMRIAMSGCLIYLLCFALFYLNKCISIYSMAFLPLISEFSIVIIYFIVAKKYNLLY